MSLAGHSVEIAAVHEMQTTLEAEAFRMLSNKFGPVEEAAIHGMSLQQ